jgi:RimJ/RimL family protein N-acetyltransferase
MNVVLETNRLSLREFTAADSDFIVQLLNTPGWLRFIGDRNVKTSEDALRYLENGPIRSYRENGFGLYLVALKETGIAVGMCGLIKREGLESVDIGFAFLPLFSGQGLAVEIAQATLAYAKNVLHLEKVLAITDPRNERSIRLLEKLGLKFEKWVVLPGQQEELLLFSTGPFSQ